MLLDMRDAELGSKQHTQPSGKSTDRTERVPYKYVPLDDDAYVSFRPSLSSSEKPSPRISTQKPTLNRSEKASNPKRNTTSPKKRKKLLIVTAAFAVVIPLVIVGTYRVIHKKDPIKDETAGTSNQTGYSIALYLPKNLPPGYTYNNDVKTLKTNVYYYTITGPGSKTFHVTQQLIPEKFDFVAFNKKFLNPEKFSTEAGTALVGPVGSNVIGSIQTLKNSWILVNSEDLSTQANVQSIVRSFSLAQ